MEGCTQTPFLALIYFVLLIARQRVTRKLRHLSYESRESQLRSRSDHWENIVNLSHQTPSGDETLDKEDEDDGEEGEEETISATTTNEEEANMVEVR